MGNAVKPLKIFISYGHEIDVKDESGNPLYPEPNNESVVRKIKAYLESRGHEIWIDREQIQPGDDDWRRKIYEGVKWANIALICLSRKAMKPNGVCRDEIAIAVGVRGGYPFSITLEELNIAEYPAYLLNPQLFTEFENWSSHCTAAKNIDEAWLDEKLERFARELENKDFQLYGDEMGELKRLLKPWNMDSRLRNLDRDIQRIYNEKTQDWESRTVHKFCGRESLFKMFEEKILQGGQAVRFDSERVLWLKKGPGFGKSRFAAELRYRYCCPITASYFIEYNEKESLEPQTFIKSIAFQLAQTNSTYRKKLLSYLKENQDSINLQTGDPQTLFKSLIIDLMVDEIDGDNGTQWILVDALDEATKNDRNEIAELISNNLKKLRRWICFFITSRDNDAAVNRNFEQFNPIEFSDEENVSDVLKYIQSEFEEMGLTVSENGVSKESLINMIHEKSEGTFLYPEMVFRDLQKNVITLDDIPNLPSGVIAYIQEQFNRLFGEDIPKYKQEIRPMLGFILTSFEPIPRAVLKYCLGIQRDSELKYRLEPLGTFFDQTGTSDDDVVKPFHKSVKDYCFDSSKSFYVFPEEAEEDFANRGLELYKSGALQWTTRTDEVLIIVQRYFLNWLPSHLMNADMTKEAADVLSNFAFLMKRLRFGNVESVVLDYILFRNKLNRISSDSDAYFDVICSNAHYLRRNSEDNPAYKTMLQIATEVADDCPVTQAAERWLNPESGESPCNWFWLNKVRRPKEYQPNPCKLVIENAGNNVILLSNGDALSWGTDDNILQIFDIQTGVCKTVLDGHSDKISRVIELRSGNILSWSADKTLRLWSPEGNCKAVLEEHKNGIEDAIELNSGDILSWGGDSVLRLWSPDGKCKTVLEGHKSGIEGAIELNSGDILSWSNDHTLRLWTPDGVCKAVLEGHTDSVMDAIELRSGDILSLDFGTMRIWSPEGTCKAVLERHTGGVYGAIELRSGDILSWNVKTLRLWSSEGKRKAVLEGHSGGVYGVIELRSGDILSWSRDHTSRVWSSDGKCKAVLKGLTNSVNGAIELRSGDILLWYEKDTSLRLWSPDGNCKAVLKGHTGPINGVHELCSGNILSWDYKTMRIWLPDGKCKSVLKLPGFILDVEEHCSGDILSLTDDYSLRLWSPEGTTCKAIPEGHTGWVMDAIELRSGDILSWSTDGALRLWFPDGKCKAVLEGHTNRVNGAIELRSGDILSWSRDGTLRFWSPDGACKAILEGHKYFVEGAMELSSGDILSWDLDSMRLWFPDGTSKEIPEEHTSFVKGAKELRSGDILLWQSYDHNLRLLSPNRRCKAVLKGHKSWVKDAIELRSGDILSWCEVGIYLHDCNMRLWSPNGTCKAVLKGHTGEVKNAIELRSGDILSWCDDKTLRLWSPNGKCKAVLKGHKDRVNGAIELSSGDILSWCGGNKCTDNDLRLWSPDGTCKAVLKGHTSSVEGAKELRSGAILSWCGGYKCMDNTLRLWSPDGTCKAVLEGHEGYIRGAIELPYGDILSWSRNNLRLWSSDGTCKAVLEEHTNGVMELSSGDILSYGLETLRIWSPDGICKEVIETNKLKSNSYNALSHPKQVNDQFFVKETWGIELQHDFKPITWWNNVWCQSRLVGDGRLCVWYEHHFDFLQLNYGNHMSISFEQAHQFLAGEIDESQLVTYDPEPKETAIPKSE